MTLLAPRREMLKFSKLRVVLHIETYRRRCSVPDERPGLHCHVAISATTEGVGVQYCESCLPRLT